MTESTKKWGLVCRTMFQGLTMSKGDIYETEADAYKELADMQEERMNSDMEPDDDFEVVEIVKQPDGSWQDTFGEKITLVDGTDDDEGETCPECGAEPGETCGHPACGFRVA